MNNRNFEVFYVVTRDGRRTSPVNYWTIDRAQRDANNLRAVLKKWGDADAKIIEIIRTSEPNSIY
jgi:hypothetical protein